MIKKGSHVQIVGIGRDNWFNGLHGWRFMNKTGVIDVVAKVRPGALFQCNIILDEPDEVIGKLLACMAVQLKEVKKSG